MSDLSPYEMIAVIYDRTERLESLLLGNGQPGIVQRMAALEERTPPAFKVKLTTGGGIAGLIAALTVLLPEFLSRLPK